MSTTRIGTFVVMFAAASAFLATSPAYAQQKYRITRAPSSTTQYLQQHAIDVDDAPGHQVRVYEIRYDYPNKDLAFAGVTVKEALVREVAREGGSQTTLISSGER